MGFVDLLQLARAPSTRCTSMQGISGFGSFDRVIAGAEKECHLA
jgi:hypothetical protein